jgi:hypothetical protein
VCLKPDERIGSDFLEVSRGSLTLRTLSLVEDAARRALAGGVIGAVTAEARNPKNDRLEVSIFIGGEAAARVGRAGELWEAEAGRPQEER